MKKLPTPVARCRLVTTASAIQSAHGALTPTGTPSYTGMPANSNLEAQKKIYTTYTDESFELKLDEENPIVMTTMVGFLVSK